MVLNFSAMKKIILFLAMDYKQRIEKVFATFPSKNRIPWKVDYEMPDITVFEEKVKLFFTGYFGVEYVKENFALPEDFRTFLKLCRAPYQIPFEMELLYDAQHIETQLPDYYQFYGKNFLLRKADNEPTDSDVMWLRFALWSDNHELLICCDRSSSAYGKIYDCYDDHPWMDDSDFGIADSKYYSFIDFLEHWYRT